MNSKYVDLFDILIKSYYDDNFDETLNKIMTCHERSPQETFSIITSLCGVDLEFDNNYVYNIKKAITNYVVNKRIIKKLEGCSGNCTADENGNYKCQMACPFNAIFYDDNLKATSIDSDRCIHCGLCVDVCKEGRILENLEFIPILNLLKENKVVIAAVSPSIIGQFGDDVTIDQLRAAFIKLGFTDMIETAFSADMLTIEEAVKFNKHINTKNNLMITSCLCPLWVGMIKKVYKELPSDFLLTVSPMVATGRLIKKLNPDAKVVYIGPCIAKKAEAKEPEFSDSIDFVLTYEEIYDIFESLDINPNELEEIPSKEYASRGGRLYAYTGGASTAVFDTIKELYPKKVKYFKPVQANGIKECEEVLDKIKKGEIKANFLEGLGCIRGCVGGPKVLVPPQQSKKTVDKFAYNSAIKVSIHNETLDNILAKINITELKDFEDCKKIKILKRSL